MLVLASEEHPFEISGAGWVMVDEQFPDNSIRAKSDPADLAELLRAVSAACSRCFHVEDQEEDINFSSITVGKRAEPVGGLRQSPIPATDEEEQFSSRPGSDHDEQSAFGGDQEEEEEEEEEDEDEDEEEEEQQEEESLRPDNGANRSDIANHEQRTGPGSGIEDDRCQSSNDGTETDTSAEEWGPEGDPDPDFEAIALKVKKKRKPGRQNRHIGGYVRQVYKGLMAHGEPANVPSSKIHHALAMAYPHLNVAYPTVTSEMRNIRGPLYKTYRGESNPHKRRRPRREKTG